MTAETEAEAEAKAKPANKALLWITAFFGLLIIAAMIYIPLRAGKPDGAEMPDIVRFLGHFHPVILHLPIGIFILIITQEFFAMFSRKKSQTGLFPLFFGASSAVLAVVLGFLLYQGGGFEGELVEDHLWGGIAFASVAVLTFITKTWVMAPGSSQIFYRFMVLASVGIMSYASHAGASITHGKDYLFEYAPDPIREILGLPAKEKEKDIEKEAKPLEQQLVYADIVQPILNLRCVECHKEGKSKGRFRMDTFDLLVKGGKEGEGIEPGNALDSNIVFRVELDQDDEEHMPPEGKKDIEDHELAVVKWWIDQGADPVKTVGELELTDAIRDAIAKLDLSVAPIEVVKVESKSDLPSEDLKATVLALSETFPGGLTFESRSSSNLTFTAVSLRKNLNDEKFAELAPVIPKLVSADLSSTAVTDKSVELLAAAKNLRTIRLSESGITDEALEILAKMPSLESINLYGTRVTDAGVRKLSVLPNLKRLYLWQTDVSQGAVSELKEAMPELEIVTGI